VARAGLVATDLQSADDPLGLPVIRDGDREINVLGEPGLRTKRHRQAPDDGPDAQRRTVNE
jgi:hypothetical protein